MSELDLPTTFSFHSYNTRFDVAVVRDGKEGSKLAVQAHLGSIPFSAESSFARRHIKSVVKVGENLPYAEIILSQKQVITIRGTMEFPDHPMPAVVVASSAVIAIAVKPFIDIISFFRLAGKAAA